MKRNKATAEVVAGELIRILVRNDAIAMMHLQRVSLWEVELKRNKATAVVAAGELIRIIVRNDAIAMTYV